MSLRVLMVSQWYDPEGGSAAQAGVIARALRDRGIDVEVLTGIPNYPSGQVAAGYRIRPYQREVLDGITVHRAPLWPSHDASAARRMGNYLSWAVSASVVAAVGRFGPDVVLVHSTPATAALPALLLNLLRGIPFVVHVQDLWPQTVLSSDFLNDRRRRLLERPLHAMCDSIYRRASAVAVTSPGMVPLVASRGIDPAKIVFVPNWADEHVFRPHARDTELARSLGIERRFTVMYAGNFGPYQRLDSLLDAADQLRERQDIGFALVGGGVMERTLRDTAARLALESVVFVPPVPFSEMTRVLALGDAHLVSLQDLALFRTTLPSKIQATLASGRPLIGAVTGDAADVVRHSGAGPVVPPGDVPSLVGAVTSLADADSAAVLELGRQARAYYDSTFSERASSTQLVELLHRAASSAPRRRDT